MKAFIARLSTFGDLARSLLRIMLGIVLTYHGYGKVFHLGFAVGPFQNMGIPIAQITGPFISLLELIGGLCLIAGLFTRYLGVLFTIEFIVAAYVKWVVLAKGYGGSELELMILLTAVLLATGGGGQISVDKSINLWEP
jgi:putative oxidoreductase